MVSSMVVGSRVEKSKVLGQLWDVYLFLDSVLLSVFVFGTEN